MTAPALLPPGDPGARLNPVRRLSDRDHLARGDTVDVLVIGGGVTGAGVVLDAVTRGLTAVLIEQEDLASGTSGMSSKLVHGGLRYLATGQIGVAWESAVERSHLATRIAPHLIRPLGQLAPIYSDDRSTGYLTGAGFLAGDLLRVAARTPAGTLPRTRRLSPAAAIRAAPSLRSKGLLGATLGWDCQLEDDARLVVALARTAAAYGARILTRTRALNLDDGGADVRDQVDGTEYRISARHVVNSTGVWAGRLDETVDLVPSAGTHVVISSAALGHSRVSLVVPVAGSLGRFVFTLPQSDGRTYIGLTDQELPGEPPDRIAALPGDVEWILSALADVLGTPLDRSRVLGTFAGMRPLVRSGTGSAPEDGAGRPGGSADISRHHLVHRIGNTITVTGGKLTTYRRMASDAVDLITEAPCRTTGIGLIGAGPKPFAPDVPDRLWRRYGNEAPLVWALGETEPQLRQPVAAGSPVLGVEFAFGASAELALTPEDLLDRRTRIGLVPAERVSAAPAAAAVIDLVDKSH